MFLEHFQAFSFVYIGKGFTQYFAHNHMSLIAKWKYGSQSQNGGLTADYSSGV